MLVIIGNPTDAVITAWKKNMCAGSVLTTAGMPGYVVGEKFPVLHRDSIAQADVGPTMVTLVTIDVHVIADAPHGNMTYASYFEKTNNHDFVLGSIFVDSHGILKPDMHMQVVWGGIQMWMLNAMIINGVPSYNPFTSLPHEVDAIHVMQCVGHGTCCSCGAIVPDWFTVEPAVGPAVGPAAPHPCVSHPCSGGTTDVCTRCVWAYKSDVTGRKNSTDINAVIGQMPDHENVDVLMNAKRPAKNVFTYHDTTIALCKTRRNIPAVLQYFPTIIYIHKQNCVLIDMSDVPPIFAGQRPAMAVHPNASLAAPDAEWLDAITKAGLTANGTPLEETKEDPEGVDSGDEDPEDEDDDEARAARTKELIKKILDVPPKPARALIDAMHSESKDEPEDP